jgi:hypothetical protein
VCGHQIPANLQSPAVPRTELGWAKIEAVIDLHNNDILFFVIIYRERKVEQQWAW